jgi:hypothetical protein
MYRREGDSGNDFGYCSSESGVSCGFAVGKQVIPVISQEPCLASRATGETTTGLLGRDRMRWWIACSLELVSETD